MIIYKITNKINNKIYIGQTIHTLERRITNHIAGSKTRSAFHAALKKYSRENFIIEEIACANTLHDLNFLEQYFIKYFNSLAPNGYNLTSGGYNKRYSNESKAKMSKSKLGIPNIKNRKPKSEKTKINMRNHIKSKDHRNKLSAANKNKRMKPIYAFNGEETILFSGIKHVVSMGFNLRTVYQALKLKIPHKGYNFYYSKEVSNG